MKIDPRNVRPFILTGYRNPLTHSTPWECMQSIFTWHNETLNIHTHLWSAVYFACAYLTRPVYACASTILHVGITLGYLGAFLMSVASTFAHTMYILDSKWYRFAWFIDCLGIIAVNYSHFFLDLFSIALYVHSPTLLYAGLGLITVFSAWCILNARRSQDGIGNWGIYYAAVASLPLTLVNYSLIQREASRWSMLCSALVVVGGSLFYSGRIPERLCNPYRMFDYVSSHMWFHICITTAIVSALSAIPDLYTLELSSSTQDRPCQT